jgi:hypothetical protein
MATSTPWGASDYKSKVTRGINFYGTPGHGGYCVSKGLAAKMHPALQSVGEWYGGALWFEEDCAYSAVYLAFPEHFEAAKVAGAHESIKDYYPDAYEAAFGVKVTAEESRTLREREHYARNVDNYVVKTAWGAWYEKCPEGFVFVVAERSADGDQKAFLIPANDYIGSNFVVDPTIHTEVTA